MERYEQGGVVVTRNARQQKLIELINEKAIETQDELVTYLQEAGFDVTQATVSRDIKELGLVKVSVDGKRQRYTKEKGDTLVTSKFLDMFRHSVVSIDFAQNIIVIKTLSGSANVAGMMVDRLKNKDVLGSVAGDDTVFAVMRNNESAERVAGQLREIVFD